jgi:transaldolase
MITVTVEVAIEAGKTVERLGTTTWVGTELTVMVPMTTEAGTEITAELGTTEITLNGTLFGTFE